MMSKVEFDPYATLNVSHDASKEEVVDAFKKLSKTFHPDRQPYRNGFDPSFYQEEFVKITEAKNILLDDNQRIAYDTYGMTGVSLLSRGIHSELNSFQVGKRYRDLTSLKYLLHQHMKKEARLELDRLISSQGQIVFEIDACGVFNEMVDTVFRTQSIPDLFYNLWYGVPTIQILLDQTDLSENNLELNQTIQSQLESIQTALKNGNPFAFENMSVSLQSIQPSMTSFVVALGHQLELNQANTLLLSGTQYSSKSNGTHSNLDLTWQHTRSETTAINSCISVGPNRLAPSCKMTKTLSPETTIEIGFNMDFMDECWTQFSSLFENMHTPGEQPPFSQRVATRVAAGMEQKSYAFTQIPSELWQVCKLGYASGHNLLWNTFNSVVHHGVIPFGALFNVQCNVKQALGESLVGVLGCTVGNKPGVNLSLFRRENTEHNVVESEGQWSNWEVNANLGVSNLGVNAKRVWSLAQRNRAYAKVSFTVIDLMKIEFGLSRSLIDPGLDSARKDVKHLIENNLDTRVAAGLEFSVQQGIHVHAKFKRGVSQCNIPIRITKKETQSWKHVLLASTIPLFIYFGYKRYWRPWSSEVKEQYVLTQMNSDGKELRQMRKNALDEQIAMSHQLVNQENGVTILCAFYGKRIEAKICSYLKKEMATGSDKCREDMERDEDEEKQFVLPVDEEEYKTSVEPKILFPTNFGKNKKNKMGGDKKRRTAGLLPVDTVNWLQHEAQIIEYLQKDESEDQFLPQWINVRICLEYFTQGEFGDSHVRLTGGSKAQLPGFYDCCPDELDCKELFVVYRYKGGTKYICHADDEEVVIPSESGDNYINLYKYSEK